MRVDREKAAAKEAQRVRLVHIMETQFAAANSKMPARLAHSAAGNHAKGSAAGDRANAHAGSERRCQWATRQECVAALQPGRLCALHGSCESRAQQRHSQVAATQAKLFAIFVQQIAAQHASLLQKVFLTRQHVLLTALALQASGPCKRSTCDVI